MKYRIVDSRGDDFNVTLYDTRQAAEIALAEAEEWVREETKREPSWAGEKVRIEEVEA